MHLEVSQGNVSSLLPESQKSPLKFPFICGRALINWAWLIFICLNTLFLLCLLFTYSCLVGYSTVWAKESILKRHSLCFMCNTLTLSHLFYCLAIYTCLITFYCYMKTLSWGLLHEWISFYYVQALLQSNIKTNYGYKLQRFCKIMIFN
jgi:hypothetical protein